MAQELVPYKHALPEPAPNLSTLPSTLPEPDTTLPAVSKPFTRSTPRRRGLRSTPTEDAVAKTIREDVSKAARTADKALRGTHRVLESWSKRMPKVTGLPPTEILPPGRYILVGRQGYDAMYNELENVFGGQGFTLSQATELLKSVGFDSNAVRARLQAFVANGSIASEPIISRVPPVEIIAPTAQKPIAEEIFGSSLNDVLKI